MKQQLLRSLLQQERVDLLHRSLQSERTGQDDPITALRPSQDHHSADPLLSVSGEDQERQMEEVASELAAVEKAILKGKQQLLRVMKRMELAQLTQDKEEEEKEEEEEVVVEEEEKEED